MGLLDRALEIRNETDNSQNTAERVGSLLEDISNVIGDSGFITRSQEIRNETIDDANTTERVGSLLEDLANELNSEFIGFSNFIRVGDITATALVFGEVLYRLARRVSPIPGSNGSLSTSNVTETSFLVSWVKAVDNNYTQANLTYKVYKSNIDNISTVEEMEANGTLVNEADDIDEHEIGGLGNLETVFFNVLVENPDGLKSAYLMNDETTQEEPEIPEQTTITGVEENFEYILLEFDVSHLADGYDIRLTEFDGTEIAVVDVGEPLGSKPIDINNEVCWEEEVDIDGELVTRIVGSINKTTHSILEDTTYGFRVRGYNINDGPYSLRQDYVTGSFGATTSFVSYEIEQEV